MSPTMNDDFIFERYNAFLESYLTKYSHNLAYIDLVDNIIKNNYLQGRLNTNLLDKIKEYHDFNYSPVNENIGFAEFPVVSDDNTFISSIMIEEETNNLKKIDHRIINKQNLDEVLSYLYSIINKNLQNINTNNKDIFILNFQKKIKIKNHHFDNINFANLEITGSSFLFAAVVAFISHFFNLPVNSNYIYTGAFDKKGNSIAVNSIDKKFEIIKQERPNTQKIFIPPINLIKDEKTISIIQSNNPLFVEIQNINDLIEKVFGKNITEICKVDTEAISSNYQNVKCKFLNNKKVTISKKNYPNETIENQNIELWTFNGNSFDVFPVDINFEQNNKEKPNYIIFNGKVANIYTGNILAHSYKQSNVYFCTKEGKDGDIRIFARPQGDTKYIGYYLTFEGIDQIIK
jgi:hypothetical protein